MNKLSFTVSGPIRDRTDSQHGIRRRLPQRTDSHHEVAGPLPQRDGATRRRAAGTSVAARAAAVALRVAAVALTAATAMLPVACASTGAVPAPAAMSGAEHPVAADEVRAVWVVRQSLSSPAAVREVVEGAAAGGFNTLIVQVRGRGDAMYRSALEPRPEFMSGQPDFDPLQLVLQEARARGMAVHAWVNAYLVWGPVDPPLHSGHLVNTHPEWLAVPYALGRELYHVDPHDPAYVRRLTDYSAANIEVVEGLYTSPSHPGVQERLHAVWMELAAGYDLDGIHHDYIRYATSAFDYSRTTLERFEAWVKPRIAAHRHDALLAAAQDDPYAFAEALPDQWDRFRGDSVSDLVRRVYADVKHRNPDLMVTAAVLPEWRGAARWRFQEWTSWLAEGTLDVAVPMAYTADAEEFHGWVDSALAAAGAPERVWAGVGAYLNPVDRTVAQIDQARAIGVSGIVVFSYDKPSEAPPPDGAAALQRIGVEAFR